MDAFSHGIEVLQSREAHSLFSKNDLTSSDNFPTLGFEFS